MKSEIKSDVPNSNRKQCPKSDRMVRNQIRNQFWNSNNIKIKSDGPKLVSDLISDTVSN